MPTQTFNASDTWEAPTGVTSVQAECWGPGGSGGAYYAGVADDPFTKENEFVAPIDGHGGGGGAYAKKLAITVIPGNFYTVTIGVVGTSDTWFSSSSTVLAKRGQNGSTGAAGLGGTATASIGDTKIAGSNGSTTTGGNAGNGGAGGAAQVNGTVPGGGGGGDTITAGGAGTGAAGRVILTWEDSPPPEPDPTVSRNQLIIIGY